MFLPSSILSLRLLQFSATQTLNPLMLLLIYRNVTMWWWGKNCVTKGQRFSVPYFLCVHCPNWDARYCDGSVEKVSKFWMYPASHLKHVGILPLVCCMYLCILFSFTPILLTICFAASGFGSKYPQLGMPHFKTYWFWPSLPDCLW